MMADYVIRDGTEADASRIAALMSELGYPTTDGEMKARLATIRADSSFRTLIW